MFKHKYPFGICFSVWTLVITLETWIFVYIFHTLAPNKYVFEVWWGFPYIITYISVFVFMILVLIKKSDQGELK